MNEKTILILGGGVGGLVAGNELRRLLPREHHIIVVEKNAQHAFAPSFLWLMTGDRKPERITRPVRELVRSGVEIVHAEARAIDVAKQQVETGARSLNYDYLIIALGTELAPEWIPGLTGAAHTFYTFEGAMKLHQALEAFTGGMIALAVFAMPYKCPGAPHEGAMLIADCFRKRGLREKVDIQMFTPEPQPMPVAGPVLGDMIKQMLQSKGISFHASHKLSAVNPQTRELTFEGKSPVKYDLLVAIPPHRAPSLVREAGLANEAGWVPVDRASLATKHENVYAIGDITAISIPGRWKPDVPMMLPKAGVFAHNHAEVVAHRIAAKINGRTPKEAFCGDGYCMLEAGEELAGFAYGNFFAEPSPQITLHKIGKTWHVGKVLFEKWWLAPFGLRRELLRLALRWGAKAKGIPVTV